MASVSKDQDYGDVLGSKDTRETTIQIALSAAIGFGAFIAFCILRPRWNSLYAARKQRRPEASPLPDLPTSMFGWILSVWKITEQQVLASAGLDAYVFLRFFKVANKFLAITLFFGLVVIKPVHDAYPDDVDPPGGNNRTHSGNGTHGNSTFAAITSRPISIRAQISKGGGDNNGGSFVPEFSTDYLWMYLIFAYLFTALALYLLVTETERIIGVRQEYLGSQSTITDRTIRLSGIPPHLRAEDKIKAFIEGLEIGKVESVFLCRDWRKLDEHLAIRKTVLHKLEVAWATFSRQSQEKKFQRAATIEQRYTDEPSSAHDEESRPLLDEINGDEPSTPGQNVMARPMKTIRHGFLYLQSRKVDAIQYYQEKLQRLDEEIKTLRRQDFEPMPLAFVTMDNVASCQMAVQAVLNPSPMQLIAHQSPAPGDVVWPNTYMSRRKRNIRAWAITIVILFLTLFWASILVPVATALNLASIKKFLPGLAAVIKEHPFIGSLVQAQFTTLFSTLLFIAVPYLYDWLANQQGMTSQGDIELSVISKNFFFVFFNYFIIFTTLGGVSTFYQFMDNFQKSLKDTTWVAYTLAQSLAKMLPFYTNLIILQGVGLTPFRLLEFGTVALTPIYRLSAKTPRDYHELSQPPQFYYGFYLPQVILIFIICIVFSVLRDSWKVLLAGLVYFLLGGFVYKYQLLYAMENRQHTTGRAWIMICNRIIIGIILFQLTTAGQLALQTALNRAAAIVPLIIATIWFSYYYRKNYNPLMRFISLSSIERQTPEDVVDPDGWGEQYSNRYEREVRPGNTVDESEETGYRFVNPALKDELEGPWKDTSETRPRQRNREGTFADYVNSVV